MTTQERPDPKSIICKCGHSAAHHKDTDNHNNLGCHFHWHGLTQSQVTEWICCPCGMSKQRLLRSSTKASAKPENALPSKRTKR